MQSEGKHHGHTADPPSRNSVSVHYLNPAAAHTDIHRLGSRFDKIDGNLHAGIPKADHQDPPACIACACSKVTRVQDLPLEGLLTRKGGNVRAVRVVQAGGNADVTGTDGLGKTRGLHHPRIAVPPERFDGRAAAHGEAEYLRVAAQVLDHLPPGGVQGKGAGEVDVGEVGVPLVRMEVQALVPVLPRPPHGHARLQHHVRNAPRRHARRHR
mmetsp:Transcript_21098/g.59358  ORF Transcript_21098/g.59358 Transcript_21098/m.59358 type:complete len:212 (-) Transcript_21098:400-1035(-)